MAEERELQVFSTKCLYDLSLSTVADFFVVFKNSINYLPENVFFDVHYQLYKKKRLCLLGEKLSDLDTFSKMLRAINRRIHLFQCFQALMDHGRGIGNDLCIKYCSHYFHLKRQPLRMMQLGFSCPGSTSQEIMINLGLRLGGFLSDAGWYSDSQKILETCKEICVMDNSTSERLCKTLDCCHKLLHVQAEYYAFEGAAETYKLGLTTRQSLMDAGYTNINYAALLSEFSVMFFMRSEYNQAYKWSIEALKELKPSLPPRIIIDVLRQASKTCVIKREFQKAGLLIKQALYLAREIFDTNHPKYSDVLVDYAFYLLNYDCVESSVTVYKTALDIRKAIFGKTNIQVALLQEDLAYALYVYEYSSGKFDEASVHVEEAIETMKSLLPNKHLMLATAQRIKALILEEIAIDNDLGQISERNSSHGLLAESEHLHLSALNLTKAVFGEENVQTAKHYGNLGRLYQSMRKYEDAEKMHLKAISLKEKVLGPLDQEVGLSVGHLASLYNFHLYRYRDAEKLYLRSIEINLKLFGKGYSGLEYDYKGLLHIYGKLNEDAKIAEYTRKLSNWKELRDRQAQSNDPPIDLKKSPQPIEQVLDTFFSM